MQVELTVPQSGESISEVFVGPWRKAVGDPVKEGEILVELETDKATLELPSPATGRLVEVRSAEGENVSVGSVIAVIETGVTQKTGAETVLSSDEAASPQAPAPAPQAPPSAPPFVMPAAQRLMDEQGLSPSDVQPTGPGGRVLKEDVQRVVQSQSASGEADAAADGFAATTPPGDPALVHSLERTSRRVPLSPIRKRIAERLVEAQHTAALLTTFNEVDMTEVIALRAEHQEAFQQRHGVKLGFMSFFVKAAVRALSEFPQVNGYIVPGEQGLEAVYHDYCDIGIAIGGGKGLVVPVLRNAEAMSFAQIESAIADMAQRAKENKITLEELQGGTFTISNGGVYGSLLSTPIVNPPQSAILGLHAIQERPVVRNGEVVVRKMMYVALTYDHRMIDGREAVTFLVRIKESIEKPSRLLFDL